MNEDIENQFRSTSEEVDISKHVHIFQVVTPWKDIFPLFKSEQLQCVLLIRLQIVELLYMQK